MEYIYAALLLHKLGKEVNEENVKAVIKATGVEPDDAKVKVVVSALDGVNIDEAIEKGMSSMAVAAAPAASAASEPSKEESKEAKEEAKEEASEEESAAGLAALFG